MHFVWSSDGRLPLVTPEIEEALYRCIGAEANRLGVTILAIGGVEDHVHLAVAMPTRVTPARLMQQVKGVSSQFVRDQFGPDRLFRWQHGYAVFSMSRSHLDQVLPYIRNQKEHHAWNELWASLESLE